MTASKTHGSGVCRELNDESDVYIGRRCVLTYQSSSLEWYNTKASSGTTTLMIASLPADAKEYPAILAPNVYTEEKNRNSQKCHEGKDES